MAGSFYATLVTFVQFNHKRVAVVFGFLCGPSFSEKNFTSSPS